MPFSTVAELKASAIFAKNKVLQQMPAFRLQRFVEQFNRVHAAILRRGGTEEEAEANALPLALAAARRFQPAPAGAQVEARKYIFATMAELQFSGGAKVEVNSFDFVRQNIEVINAVVAGNSFNLKHNPADPVGIIHRILLPSEVSAEVRAKEPDAPFFVEASYFEDTPDAIRNIETVSAEWLRLPRADGTSEVILPDSFAITDDPATDRILGVGRVANTTADVQLTDTYTSIDGKPYEDRGGSGGAGIHMTSQKPAEDGPEARVASLESELKDLKEKFAAAEGRETDLKARIATLAGVKEPEDEDPVALVRAAEKKFAAAMEKAEKAERLASELIQADKERKAEAFAEKVWEERELPVEAKAEWAALFLENPERAEKLASGLQPRGLRAGATKAIGNVPQLGDDDVKELQAEMEAIYKRGKF